MYVQRRRQRSFVQRDAHLEGRRRGSAHASALTQPAAERRTGLHPLPSPVGEVLALGTAAHLASKPERSEPGHAAAALTIRRSSTTLADARRVINAAPPSRSLRPCRRRGATQNPETIRGPGTRRAIGLPSRVEREGVRSAPAMRSVERRGGQDATTRGMLESGVGDDGERPCSRSVHRRAHSILLPPRSLDHRARGDPPLPTSSLGRQRHMPLGDGRSIGGSDDLLRGLTAKGAAASKRRPRHDPPSWHAADRASRLACSEDRGAWPSAGNTMAGRTLHGSTIAIPDTISGTCECHQGRHVLVSCMYGDPAIEIRSNRSYGHPPPW